MPNRLPTALTAKKINAARRNIRRAQLSRIGIREPRSPGRVMRKRLYAIGRVQRVARTRRR